MNDQTHTCYCGRQFGSRSLRQHWCNFGDKKAKTRRLTPEEWHAIVHPTKPAHVPNLTERMLQNYGQPDSQEGDYYVDARDGDRSWLLLGPFSHHEVAIRMVDNVRAYATETFAHSAFYQFGTCRLEKGTGKPGTGNARWPEAFALDRHLLLPSPWCDACKSFHCTPMDREHHAALKCQAPFVADGTEIL